MPIGSTAIGWGERRLHRWRSNRERKACGWLRTALRCCFPGDVAAIEESAPDVEIGLRYEGVIVVRARGFHDAADRSAFLAELKDRWAGRSEPMKDTGLQR